MLSAIKVKKNSFDNNTSLNNVLLSFIDAFYFMFSIGLQTKPIVTLILSSTATVFSLVYRTITL